MKRKESLIRSVTLSVLIVVGMTFPVAIQAESAAASSSPGLASLQNASQHGKYLFVYFWKQNDRQTQAMFGVFQSATAKMPQVADAISVNITDPKERPMVDQFDVSRAPMPLLLAIAPNGAITKGIATSFTERQLQEALVSQGTAACLKALQDRKLVLLCLQNQAAPVAFSGVSEFVADPKFAATAEVVTINSTDRTEAGLLQSLQLDPRRDSGRTVLLAPPGNSVATFTNAATKEQIVARVTASSSGCCPGGSCGPNGCGPR